MTHLIYTNIKGLMQTRKLFVNLNVLYVELPITK